MGIGSLMKKYRNLKESIHAKPKQVVREYLEFFGLHSTLSVYKPECSLDEPEQEDDARERLCEQVGLEGAEAQRDAPLLAVVLDHAQENSAAHSRASHSVSAPPAHIWCSGRSRTARGCRRVNRSIDRSID